MVFEDRSRSVEAFGVHFSTCVRSAHTFHVAGYRSCHDSSHMTVTVLAFPIFSRRRKLRQPPQQLATTDPETPLHLSKWAWHDQSTPPRQPRPVHSRLGAPGASRRSQDCSRRRQPHDRPNGPSARAPPGDLTAATRATAALLSVPCAPLTPPHTTPPSPADNARLRQRTGVQRSQCTAGSHKPRRA